MNKIVKNGKVAVAVSTGGAGWSSWENVSAFDPVFNQLFLDGRYDEAYDLAESLGLYNAGIHNVEVVWIPEGSEFIIRECDGIETIIMRDGIKWLKA